MSVNPVSEHRWFVVLLGFLVLIGMVNLYSALYLWGGESHLALFGMQLLWIALGGIFAWLLYLYDYRLLYRSCWRWHGVAVVLLLLVLLTGQKISGHRSWFAIAGLGIQPSEFAKLTTVLVLARFFTDHIRPKGFALADIWQPVVLAGVPMGLILLQGDLGTALFVGLLLASFLLFARLKWRLLVVLVVLTAAGGGLAYQTLLTPSQKGRITSFLHPEDDPRGRGYHLMQSKLAVGSGGWLGKGYLKGEVNKLRFLPEKHTDFIFPVLAEEWGFVGSMVTVACYFGLLMVGLSISRTSRDRFGVLLALGITFWLFWQIAINLGGVLGLIPLTGITLPFLSYGGSSIIVGFAAMGLLLSIHRRRFVF